MKSRSLINTPAPAATQGPPAEDVRDLVAGRERDVLIALGIEDPAKGKTHIHCPFPDHPDKHPSWRWDRRQARFHCTCGSGDIFEMIKRMHGTDYPGAADLCRDVLRAPPFRARPNGHGRANGRGAHEVSDRVPSAIYDYESATGEPLFQVVRFEPKDFRQRRPDPNKPGEWISNLEGVARVPYRLPELIESVAGDHPVFIVEGEKDVDALCKLFIPATCNPGGAGKWKPEYNEHLRGADVVIIPDNDQPGRDHAADVARHLTGVAKRVRLLTLPGLQDKGDVSDWLASGGTVESLWALADQAPDFIPDSVARIANGKDRPLPGRASPAETEAKINEYIEQATTLAKYQEVARQHAKAAEAAAKENEEARQKAEQAAEEARQQAAEAEAGRKQKEQEVVDKLAGLGTLEYDRARERAAKGLGIRVTTLDSEVEKRKPEVAPFGEPIYPYWSVEPADAGRRR
jgi:hypothetical protein